MDTYTIDGITMKGLEYFTYLDEETGQAFLLTRDDLAAGARPKQPREGRLKITKIAAKNVYWQ